MKIVIQRVKDASVFIEEDNIFSARIKEGILALIGFCNDDIQKTDKDFIKIIKKLLNFRIFEDPQGKMNLSLIDIKGSIILVSQFTLCADPYQGNRPSFTDSLDIKLAENLYNDFINFTKEQYIQLYQEKYHTKPERLDQIVQTGKFRANMQVQLINDGPVTFILEY